jgi:hypothetical protein
MAAEAIATCGSCQLSWSLVDLTYRIGPIDYNDPTFHKWWCPQCLIVLHHVSRIDRNAWTRWCHANAAELSKSKFATTIRDCISEIVARQNWYVPVDVQLSHLRCPRCPKELEIGDWDLGKVYCPQCHQRTGQLAPIDTLVSVVYPDGIP